MKYDDGKLQTRLVIGIIVVVLVYVIFTILSDVEQIYSIFSEMDYSFLIFIVFLFSFSLILRSFIQKCILQQLGIKITFRQSLLLYSAGLSMLITPLGIGQTIKSNFLYKQYGVPYARSIPLVLAERLYDFISIIIFLWVTLIFVYRDESLIVLIFSTILLFSILLSVKNNSCNSFFKKIFIKSSFLSRKISSFDELVNSISKITNIYKILKIIPLVFVAVFIESVIIYLGFLSFHIDSNYFNSFQLFYSSLLLGIFSFLPGGVGITEGSFITLIMNDGISMSVGSSLIIFLRSVTIWSFSIIGFIFTFYFLRKFN
jgi:uncharacterized protein (TIRG00374 family)